MFSDIHINQVLLAELVDGANSGLATVSGDVRKRTFFDKSVKKCIYLRMRKAQFYPKHRQWVERGIFLETRRLTGTFPGPNASQLPVFFFLRVDDKMEAAS